MAREGEWLQEKEAYRREAGPKQGYGRVWLTLFWAQILVSAVV